MIVVAVLSILLLLAGWLLLAPIIIFMDSRVPVLKLTLVSVGSIHVFAKEGKWWIKFRVLLFEKTKTIASLKSKKSATQKRNKKEKHQLPQPTKTLVKLARVIKSFSIKRWQLAIDTGDYALNGSLFGLCLLPHFYEHLSINFFDENYLVLQLHNTPLRMLLAYVNLPFLKT